MKNKKRYKQLRTFNNNIKMEEDKDFWKNIEPLQEGFTRSIVKPVNSNPPKMPPPPPPPKKTDEN